MYNCHPCTVLFLKLKNIVKNITGWILRVITLKIILVCLVFCNPVFAQKEQVNNTFRSGENLNYKVYYNWEFIWLAAGEVQFSVESSEYLGKDVFHLCSTGSTYRTYDWFYKVRDRYDSWVGVSDLKPLKSEKTTHEGDNYAMNAYYFDYPGKELKAIVKSNSSGLKVSKLKLRQNSFDLLSAIYHIRNFDFTEFKTGEIMPVTILLDDQYYDLYIRYLGKDIAESKNGNKYHCHKFSALLIEGTIFKGGEEMFIWVTDDENKIPVQVEAEVLLGSVKAILINFDGLMHPVKSEIK